MQLLSVAQIVPVTEAEGPGKRFALWFQGCPLRCAGCCNPEFLPFRGGESFSVTEIVEQIATTHSQTPLEGISLLGGEPMAHAAGAAELARQVHTLGLGVMVYSGYTLEEIRNHADPDQLALLAETDLLVDGPYIREQPEMERRWIGSRNQRVHFLTSRYSPDDPCWHRKNTLEIRVEGLEVTVNGFPAAHALGLWKKPRKIRSQ